MKPKFCLPMIVALMPFHVFASCPGPFPTTNIAVSVQLTGNLSIGKDSLLTYNQISLNEGGAWGPTGASHTFVTPCSGIYHFSSSFVKNGYLNGGTSDDVAIFFLRNGAVIPITFAWAGEGTIRGQASTTFALRLKQYDQIQTWIHSDSGAQRNIVNANLTIYRIGN